MSKVMLSAFSDEAGSSLALQIKALEENNLKYMEIRGVDGKNISELTLDEVREVANLLKEKGISVSAIGSPIGKINVLDDFTEHLELFGHILDIADILECRYIRMFSFFIPEGENPDIFRDTVIKRWKAFIKKSQGRGVTLLHENEKDIYGDTAKRCLDLIDTLKCDFLKLTFDPANFVQCNEEVYPYAYETLKDHIEYFHIKDAVYTSGEVVPAGYGDGKLKDIVRILRDKNYQGFMTLEPHLSDFDGFSDLEGVDSISLGKEDNEEKFKLAVSSLKNILDGYNYRY